ncbi:hypothetical protein LCGC14_0917960 [marine sediment metagenome]|uniref:Uncharacterized protein n=1 Tax=marine sediment metagenome TaxID=412755 RepID=A0A0F9RAA5_9ZZZZ
MANIKTVVISAFPGTGKTYTAENSDLNIQDSDSSNFSWKSPGIRNPEFPQNYVEHIKGQMGKHDIIFVSSHQEVRDALLENGIRFVLIHPLREDKSTYLERFLYRGDDPAFIDMMEEKWDEFLDSMYAYENYGEIAILLLPGTFISNYIPLAIKIGEEINDGAS